MNTKMHIKGQIDLTPIVKDELRQLIDRGGQIRKGELLEQCNFPTLYTHNALIELVDEGEIYLFPVGNVTKIRPVK